MNRFPLPRACALVSVFALSSLAGGSALVGARAARADVVLDWNVTALTTTASAPFNPPLESRNVAIMHAAVFDAVNAILRGYEHYAVDLHAREEASPEAAAAAAAHATLVRLYPDLREALDAAYAASLASIPAGPARAAGIALGETAAAKLLAMRETDGAAAAIALPYTPGARPGDWSPTPPAFRPALDPGWGSVKPFLLESGSQFRPGPPPTPGSWRYARDVEEIRAAGSLASSTRTQAETDLARFWIATGAQNWNPAARQVAAAQRRTLLENARAFALLNMAGADAFIAAWDAKFTFNQWRPVTAIRAAGVDPSWTPLLATPPFPDYIAGHTAFAGAAAEVLNEVFGRRSGVTMTLTNASAPGVVLVYTSFEDIAEDVVDARVWGGIHWRTSSVRGKRVGEEVGRYAVDRALRPAHSH